ncbi:MAG: helix-turn-helix transcriptional regulator [Synergistaceae bacterium]|nr:helix-turn-helix transcriptional regulator [Synergistaceae bacterium]
MFGEIIKKRRVALKLTQRELAALVGVNRTTVVAWEQERFPPTKKIAALENALDITRGELYFIIHENRIR